MIGVEELDPPFREVPFFQLMTEFCDGYSDFYTNGCENFAVVWNYADDAGFFEEIHIQQIYNHDTGEVIGKITLMRWIHQVVEIGL